MQWSENFDNAANPSIENTHILILDGHHISHKSLDAVKFAKYNDIIVITLPPHSTHKYHPLDLRLFQDLKSNYYYTAYDGYMLSNPD